MSENTEKVGTQVDGALLDDLRVLAKEEGHQVEALIEEAIRRLLEQRRQAKARPHVMAAYDASHARFGPLYKKLAVCGCGSDRTRNQ